MSEIVKVRNDESLVAPPYLDILIKEHQESLQHARAQSKKERKVNRVNNYLKRKLFCASVDVRKFSKKEFSMIERRARNYYLARTVSASLWSLASIGGILKGFAYMFAAWPESVSAGLFFGGFGITVLATTSLVFALIKTNRIAKILAGKYNNYDRW